MDRVAVDKPVDPVAVFAWSATSVSRMPPPSCKPGIGGAAVGLGILRDNLAWQGTPVMNMAGADVANNSRNRAGVPVASADFQSTSLDGWDAPRLPDGSLPALP